MKKSAFTLIELLTVIAIIALLMMVSFVPYSHYQKKAKIRIAGREISQNFYVAKNMAVSGIRNLENSEDSENMSIGLYLNTNEGNNDIIKIFSYPYNIEENNINIDSTNVLKVFNLQEGIRINYLSGYENLLFYFEAINGNVKIYSFTKNIKEQIDEEQINIGYSYLNSESPSLQKKLIYFKNTNIIDYE